MGLALEAGSMRIEVLSSDEPSAAQLHAYAEYRVFATLARHARMIRTVKVVIRQATPWGDAERWTCFVEAALEPSGSARTRATARHPRGAIDAAATRIGDRLGRRTDVRLSRPFKM